MDERLAKHPKTLAALSAFRGGQWKYAAQVILYFMQARDQWPAPRTYNITWDEGKHARRAVTTAFMLDLDWFAGVP